MTANIDRQEGNRLSREDALEHAALAAGQGVAAQLAGLERWEKARIRRKPVEIFDINGDVLFFDYSVVRSGEIVGTVRTAASRVIGTPVVAHIVGPNLWDFDDAVEKLTPKVEKAHPKWKIRSTRLVCYSYPKLGVMFDMTDATGKLARLIYDVADYTRVPEETPEAGEREGCYAWSFYDSLSLEEQTARLARYDEFDQVRLLRSAEGRGLLQTETSVDKLASAVKATITIPVIRQLQFCAHYASTEARSHHCFVVHAQQKNDYCAVATCQMVLCYYRYYYTQDNIAPALGYSSGGCPSDQSPGYRSLSCNHLAATYDTSPTWEEANTEIGNLHPLKTGIAGHARACAGVSSILNIPMPLGPGAASITNKKLYVYDPWPWNADYKLGGQIYWEEWSAVTHTNYVFTKLQY
ncbi:MAG: hypothetical protein U0X20_24560 [Caldilineaceae bacterium]